MSAIAGRVMPLMKGAYSSTATYEPLDFVTYNNALWGCIKETTGNTPTEGTYWKKAIDGEVGDAASLGGETASAWQTKLDNIQTTSRATLSEPGWYRVAEYKGIDNSDLNGIYANLCELIVRRTYINNSNEEHIIALWSVSGNQEFSSYDKSSEQLFTKVRYTKDNSTVKAYIELYYKASTANICDFAINKAYVTNVHHWQAITPTLTSETVDGVTVTTTYDIPANASPVTDLDIAEAMENYLYPLYG